ncbi:hypothetical protein SCLCIDRAFT_1223919, partial [Scleroderma citrinum Foug A]
MRIRVPCALCCRTLNSYDITEKYLSPTRLERTISTPNDVSVILHRCHPSVG